MSLTDSFVDAVKKYNAVRCDTCGHVELLSGARKVRAFVQGWPECHGETMRLHNVEVHYDG